MESRSGGTKSVDRDLIDTKLWGVRPESGDGRGDGRGDARQGRLRLMLFLGAILSLITAARAMAADITACGTTITQNGFYRVAQNLTATQGDCIDVKAAHTVLFLNGKTITGSGAGVGVKVLSSASHSFIEGANATITSFGIGIEDDASFVRADNFNANSNSTGGVLLSSAKNSTFSNFQASNNGIYGVRFANGANSVAESAMVTGNGAYGFWLDGAKGERIDNFDAEHNAFAGVYIGCSPSGPGNSCPGRHPHFGSSNQVYNGFADGNGPYGVAIDAGASSNLVTSVESMNNKSADMLDKSSNCGSDSWFGNAFANATPTGCIN